MSADAISHFGVGSKVSPSQAQFLVAASHLRKSSSQDRLAPDMLLQSLSQDDGLAVFIAGLDFNHKSFEAFNKSFEKLLAKNTPDVTPAKTTISSAITSSEGNTKSSSMQSSITSLTSYVQLSSSSSTTSSSIKQQVSAAVSATAAAPANTQTKALQKAEVAPRAKYAPSPALRNPFDDGARSPRSSSSIQGMF